jgi:hypothetical protein
MKQAVSLGFRSFPQPSTLLTVFPPREFNATLANYDSAVAERSIGRHILKTGDGQSSHSSKQANL